MIGERWRCFVAVPLPEPLRAELATAVEHWRADPRTDGLRWALVDATLAAGTTRGVSNELAAATATVSVGDGVVAVLQPGTRAEVVPRSTPYDPTPR